MPRVQALSAGRRTLNRLLFSRCLPQEDRTEIRPVVVRIEIFSSLKEPYYQVGKRSGHHFIYHLEYPLRENRGQQQARSEAKDGIISCLLVPNWSCRDKSTEVKSDYRQQVTRKT